MVVALRKGKLGDDVSGKCRIRSIQKNDMTINAILSQFRAQLVDFLQDTGLEAFLNLSPAEHRVQSRSTHPVQIVVRSREQRLWISESPFHPRILFSARRSGVNLFVKVRVENVQLK